MIVYLIRHGETHFNRNGLGLGRSDVSLTATGQSQAAAIARRFAATPLDRTYTSPLARAVAVGQAISTASASPLVTSHDLIELDVGDAEGITGEDMRARFPDFFPRWLGSEAASVPMPGGESLADVDRRVERFLGELRNSDDDAVAVVSHNFVLKVMLCRLLELPLSSFRRFSVDLASISTIMIRGERISVVSVNDTCHLKTLEP